MSSWMTGSRCTVQRHNGNFCDAPSAEDMPFPICGRHAAELYRHISAAMTGLAGDHVLMIHNAATEIREKHAREDQRKANIDPKVYYVQVGEYIKIGVTTQLKQRLQSYPPNKRLLATEPGDDSLERKRHEQFARLLTHGHEWFRIDAGLIEHINVLREAAGATRVEMDGTSLTC